MSRKMLMNPSRPGLRLAQLGWIILALFSIGKFGLSEIVYYQGIDQVCTAPIHDCHEREQATLQDIAGLRADGLSPEQWALANIAYRTFNALVFCAVGFLIFARQHTDPAALFTSLFLILFGTQGGNGGSLAARFPEFHLLFGLIQFPAYVSLPLFFFSFPDGRIVPRAMWIIVFVWSFFFLIDFLVPGIDKSTAQYGLLSDIAWLSMFLGGTAAQVFRYVWVSNPEQKRQTKWVVFSVIVFTAVAVGATFLPAYSQMMDNTALYSAQQILILALSNMSVSIIPISIGIAILRYRLWDIDIIIRRTLSYALLTALLGAVYFSGVTVMQSIFTTLSGQQSPAALVVSTLLIAALFTPLRKRIQAFIDQRFYRRKYDAEKALAEFAAAARSETDIDQLSAKLLAVLKETMQPERVSVWLKPEGEINEL